MNEEPCDTIQSITADTLAVPEMLARQDSVETVELTKVYRMGYFQDNPLLHPEVKGHQVGIAVKPLEDQLWRNDWMTSLVLLCFVLLILVLRRSGRHLWNKSKQFLFTPRGHNELAEAETSVSSFTTFFLSFLLSLMVAFLVLWYLQQTQPAHLALRFPYVTLGICTAVSLLCLLLRYNLYRFVNWVFFDKGKYLTWNKDYKFLLSVESILIFPAVIMSIYLEFSLSEVFRILLTIVIVVKILLFLKAYQTFFKEFHGIFHIIVYLCTLETVPVLAVFGILSQLSGRLDEIF